MEDKIEELTDAVNGLTEELYVFRNDCKLESIMIDLHRIAESLEKIANK